MSIRGYLSRPFTLGQCLFWLWAALVLILLGAHFYRASEYGIVLCTVGMLGLFCSRTAWKRWAVALFLLWGMVEWTSSACLLAQTRLMMGMPWMRGALILSAVAVVTGLTGVALARQAMRFARGLLMMHNREAERLNISTTFDAGMTSMIRVDVEGNTDANGQWLVDEVEHDLHNGQSTAKLLRVLTI